MLHNFLVINIGLCTLAQIKNQLVMKKILLLAAIALGSQAFAQFKDVVIVNGITYTAKDKDLDGAVYIQQDHFDFTLAADSFYVDVMTEAQYNAYARFLVKEEKAEYVNGMYHVKDGSQVFVSEDRDKTTGNLMVIRLFGSVDTGQ